MTTKVLQYDHIPEVTEIKIDRGSSSSAELAKALLGPDEPLKHHSAQNPMHISKDSDKVKGLIDDFINYHIPAYCEEFEVSEESVDPEDVLSWLQDEERLSAGLKPRLEFRLVVQDEVEEIANIAFLFADGETRTAARKGENGFGKNIEGLSVVTAGRTTVELGKEKVNKATVIDAVSKHLPEMLPDYTPGPLINAMAYHSVLCLDADGTLWKAPGKDLEGNHLGNSPTHEVVLEYLRAGGVLAVISGNDPQRTVNRFLLGIPEEEREELLPRVILSGAGGHTLMTYQNGQFQEYKAYRETAILEQGRGPSESADLIYLGDDPKIEGNDFPGFDKVGEDRSVCVTNKGEQYTRPVEGFLVPGEPKAVKEIIGELLHVRKLVKNPGLPLFTEYFREYLKTDPEAARAAREEPTAGSSIPPLRSSVKARLEAEVVVASTLDNLEGRDRVNQLVSYCDQVANAPVVYKRATIETLKGLHESPGGELSYDRLCALSDSLKARLQNPENYHTFPKVDGVDKMQETLARMNLQDGDVVRILVPGNNDQANPMYVARQIQEIQRRTTAKLNIQVLVMGQGGHATTATFHQFASVKGDYFLGVEEADTLGGTLKGALEEEGFTEATLLYDVDQFQAKEDLEETIVQVKLARGSRHTGMNVDEANETFQQDEEGKKPRHIFVTSTIASSTRQALTFAYQMDDDTYETITAIPLPRSAAFVETALDDRQAVTEMYAGLAERARYYLYAFQEKPFIPPTVIDREDLDNLYAAYDKLSAANDIETSKQTPMLVMFKFFQENFATLEQAITWGRDPKLQKEFTKGLAHLMASRNPEEFRRVRALERSERAQAAYMIYDNLTQAGENAFTPEQVRTIALFARRSNLSNDESLSRSERLKYYEAMGDMVPLLRRIES